MKVPKNYTFAKYRIDKARVLKFQKALERMSKQTNYSTLIKSLYGISLS